MIKLSEGGRGDLIACGHGCRLFCCVVFPSCSFVLFGSRESPIPDKLIVTLMLMLVLALVLGLILTFA